MASTIFQQHIFEQKKQRFRKNSYIEFQKLYYSQRSLDEMKWNPDATGMVARVAPISVSVIGGYVLIMRPITRC